MYSKAKDKLNIDKDIMDQLIEFNELLKKNNMGDSNNIVLAEQISCSACATLLSAKSSNEIEGITINSHNCEYPNDEVNKYIDNYNLILKYIKDDSLSIPFNSSEILGWHNQMFKNTLKQNSCGGKWKTTNNYVIDENKKILFQGVEPWLTPQFINELIDWYNQSNELAILKIIIFNADFLMIHPFNDGNGRMSRIIMNYLLIKEGYSFFKYVSLEQIILKYKAQYLDVLKTINTNWSEHKSNYKPIIIWFLNIFKEAINLYDQMFDIQAQFNKKVINKKQAIVKIIKQLHAHHIVIKRSEVVNFAKDLGINLSNEIVKITLASLVKNGFLTINKRSKATIYELSDQFINDLNNEPLNIVSKKKYIYNL